MVSKKLIAPTLAGTGAAGASAALSWTLGLLGDESLGDVGDGEKEKFDKEDSRNSQSHSYNTQKLSTGHERAGARLIIKKQEITGTEATSSYFTVGGASEKDKQAINTTLTWKIEWLSGSMQSIMVRAEEPTKEDGTKFSWDCRLKPIAFERINSDQENYAELERQGGDLIKAIKDSVTHKEKFVENCSKRGKLAMPNEIYLETEKSSNGKVMFKESNGYFQKLWTEDFSGVDKLSEEDEKIMGVTNWNMEETIEKTNKTWKIKISSKENKKWDCHISGGYVGNLGAKKFKDDKLEEVLNLFRYEDEEEKKKYLIRNCLKNNKDIKGLKIKVDRSNWRFEEESLKKITEGMYTNPIT